MTPSARGVQRANMSFVLRFSPRAATRVIGATHRISSSFSFSSLSSQRPNHEDVVYAPLPDGSADEALLKEILLKLTGGPGQHCESLSQDEDFADKISLTPVYGGITNQLYRADFSGCKDDLSPLLVRIFGGEGMIDRNVENDIFAELAEAGVAVPYHGRFGNGRVEGWLDGADALELSEMGDPVVSAGVAKQLAKLHNFSNPFVNQKGSPPEASMWPQLWSWLKQAQNTCHEIESKWGPEVAARFDDIHSKYFSLDQSPSTGERCWNLSRVETELVDLERSLAASPVVFAHNDVLAGNIMLNRTNGDITLIDFEYGGPNYRGFDIANHWNEWAGGTQAEMNGRCEYHRFPSPEQQASFAENYLREEALQKAETMLKMGMFDKDPGQGASDEQALLESIVDATVDETAVKMLVEEANSFVLVNHWYWGLWAVNQATLEGINDFDYLTYAESRAQRYFETKERNF